MSNWYHGILGRYNISDKWIGLDYANLFRSEAPVAESVLAHEMAHIVNSDTLFMCLAGSILETIESLLDAIHRSHNDVDGVYGENRTRADLTVDFTREGFDFVVFGVICVAVIFLPLSFFIFSFEFSYFRLKKHYSWY